MFLFCLVFAMSLCASVYMCFVVTCCGLHNYILFALLWTPQGSGANGFKILYMLVINENGLFASSHFFSCLHLLCSGIIMHLYIGCPETFSCVSFRQDGILGIVMQ